MFESLNLFFDKIYVLTLHRATDSADKKELDIAGLIKEGKYNPILAKKQHLMHKEMTDGEIGCALSHKMMYEDVIKNNFRRVLILEDDVVIDEKNIHLFSTMQAELPVNWQLWYLGFAKNQQPPVNATFKKIFYHLLYALRLKTTMNHTMINNLYPSAFSAHLSRAGFHDCTHAYAITLEAAKILLHEQTPIAYTADNLLAFTNTHQKLQAFISKPTLINQQYQVMQGPTLSYLNQ
jgi:glycosyl transferase, family 25